MQPLTAYLRRGAVARRAGTNRRDPAPSRWVYRMHRLWLTPLFWRFLRVGVPVFLVVFAGVAYFGNARRRTLVIDGIASIRRQIETRPEFMVSMVAIDGASAPLARAIRDALDLSLPQSTFALDLDVLRSKLEGLDAVASADLQVKAGGILQVTVHERQGAVVWRSRGGLQMLDATGYRVAALTGRDVRTDLPLIAGRGANRAVPEALALIAASGLLRPRLRGLTRQGERRWNMVLDRGQKIELPETNPVTALEHVIALDRVQDLLARDVTVVDMRNPERPTLRLTTAAVAALKQLRESERGTKSL